MALQKLNRADWQSYCARISRGIERGQRAELEIVALDLGDRIEARWLPVNGLVYEPKTDQLEIALEGVDHLVAHPRELLIESTPRGVVGIEILTNDDVRQMVRFLEPLSLSPRGHHGQLRRERRRVS